MLKIKTKKVECEGKCMGRARKPFMEKSTNIFLTFTNIEIEHLLKKYKIEYETPNLVWDDETKKTLINKIKQELLNL